MRLNTTLGTQQFARRFVENAVLAGARVSKRRYTPTGC
jgi:hypothetical protein